MSKVTFEYAGFTGRGTTLTEAKRNAHDQAEAALRGDYVPVLVQRMGYTAVIWREPIGGWFYTILQPKHHTIRIDLHDHFQSSGGDDTREACERSARRHLTQYLFRVLPDNEVAGLLANERDRNEFLDWCEWQHRFAAWRAAGANDNLCHAHASSNRWPDAALVAAAQGHAVGDEWQGSPIEAFEYGRTSNGAPCIHAVVAIGGLITEPIVCGLYRE